MKRGEIYTAGFTGILPGEALLVLMRGVGKRGRIRLDFGSIFFVMGGMTVES
jgi:hypothetical protein